MISRGQNFKNFSVNVCGSSTFGRYGKVSKELTRNMLLSDGWLVDYAGYQSVDLNHSRHSWSRHLYQHETWQNGCGYQ